MATKKAGGPLKLYRNEGVSTLVIEGKELHPGDEFRAALEPEFEMQMLMGGHLVILEDQSVAADQAQAQAAEEGASGATDTGNVVETSERRGRRDRS